MKTAELEDIEAWSCDPSYIIEWTQEDVDRLNKFLDTIYEQNRKELHATLCSND